jgi:hypothetical protein
MSTNEGTDNLISRLMLITGSWTHDPRLSEELLWLLEEQCSLRHEGSKFGSSVWDRFLLLALVQWGSLSEISSRIPRLNYVIFKVKVSITVAAQAEALNVFARSNTVIVGLTPKIWMSMCVYFVFVLYMWRPCVWLIPRPKSLTDYLKLRNWSETKLSRMPYAPSWRERKVKVKMFLCHEDVWGSEIIAPFRAWWTSVGFRVSQKFGSPT